MISDRNRDCGSLITTQQRISQRKITAELRATILHLWYNKSIRRQTWPRRRKYGTLNRGTGLRFTLGLTSLMAAVARALELTRERTAMFVRTSATTRISTMDKKFLVFVFQTLYLVTQDPEKAKRFVQRQAKNGHPVRLKVVST